MAAINNKKPSEGDRGADAYRPRFARQMLFAGVTLAAILTGYFAFQWWKGEAGGGRPADRAASGSPGAGPEAESAPRPWYKKQGPPPAMITAPDIPIFPEQEEGPQEPAATAKTRLAYEEALPRDIYVPEPIPVAPAPAEPAPTPRPGPAEVAALPVPAVPQTATPAGERPPWRRFAVAPGADTGGPMIAMVIDDMGVDRKRSERIVALGAPLTLSFLTYAEDLPAQTERARGRGHELMLHVSMEPGSKAVDPGPNVLLTDLGEDELRRRLEWGFARFSSYVGVNNHMGSKFTSDAGAMRIVLEEIKRRGLLFLDSRTSAKTVAAELSRQMGIPTAERNVFLDHVNEVAAVNRQLAEVEALARKHGYAVAIGHPREATIRALGPWLERLNGRGIRLVPLSAVVAGNQAPSNQTP